MAEARGRLEWAQTSEVLCVLYNANRDVKKRKRPFTAGEFNPYAGKGRKAGTRITAANIGNLKEALLGRAQIRRS